jgi:hypothetical protein
MMTMNLAENICTVACGLFFLIGLLTGVWKYAGIRRSPDFRAPRYVSVSHITALMYSFACLVLLELSRQSPLPDAVEAGIVIAIISFFALAQGSYLLHGLLRDTDNQLARPHRLATRTWPSWTITLFMLTLILVEVGGFLILFLAAVW